MFERLTELHVTRPQVHLQGSPQQPTHVTKGPVCIHLFQVLFEILNRDILRSTMLAKMLSPKFRADSLEAEQNIFDPSHLHFLHPPFLAAVYAVCTLCHPLTTQSCFCTAWAPITVAIRQRHRGSFYPPGSHPPTRDRKPLAGPKISTA